MAVLHIKLYESSHSVSTFIIVTVHWISLILILEWLGIDSAHLYYLGGGKLRHWPCVGIMLTLTPKSLNAINLLDIKFHCFKSIINFSSCENWNIVPKCQITDTVINCRIFWWLYHYYKIATLKIGDDGDDIVMHIILLPPAWKIIEAQVIKKGTKHSETHTKRSSSCHQSKEWHTRILV